MALEAEKLNWRGINFPVDLTKAPAKFESKNADYALCIIGFEEPQKVYPVKAVKDSSSKKVIDLLLFDGHLCLIKDLSRLLGKEDSEKKVLKRFVEAASIAIQKRAF